MERQKFASQGPRVIYTLKILISLVTEPAQEDSAPVPWFPGKPVVPLTP